jgi:hypothetical protein
MYSLTPLAALLLALALVVPGVLVFQGSRSRTGLIPRLRALVLVPDGGWITLADAAQNADDDVDLTIINEFRKSTFLLDSMPFDDSVNPNGGGTTLTYGYRRQITERPADFRPINMEYVPAEARAQRFTVDLKPLGGAFNLDRVLASVGPAASGEIAFQMREVISSTRTRFAQEVILGDVATDAEGFDGLDASLSGTITEYNAAAVADWSGATLGDDRAKANDALDALDEWLALLDGIPSAIMGNTDGIARLRSLARRAGYYERSRDGFGTEVETYRGIPFADLRERSNSTAQIVPTETRTVGSPTTNLTDLYAARMARDGLHGVSTNGKIVQQWLPDWTTSGAVKTGEVEFGPVAICLRKTRAAGVFRNIKVR